MNKAGNVPPGPVLKGGESINSTRRNNKNKSVNSLLDEAEELNWEIGNRYSELNPNSNTNFENGMREIRRLERRLAEIQLHIDREMKKTYRKINKTANILARTLHGGRKTRKLRNKRKH